MHIPKLVEAERCAIYPTLKMWYENEDIVVSLAHPALVFNADETQISIRGRRKILFSWNACYSFPCYIWNGYDYCCSFEDYAC